MMKSLAKPLVALFIGSAVIAVGLAAFVWSGVYGIGASLVQRGMGLNGSRISTQK